MNRYGLACRLACRLVCVLHDAAMSSISLGIFSPGLAGLSTVVGTDHSHKTQHCDHVTRYHGLTLTGYPDQTDEHDEANRIENSFNAGHTVVAFQHLVNLRRDSRNRRQSTSTR